MAAPLAAPLTPVPALMQAQSPAPAPLQLGSASSDRPAHHPAPLLTSLPAPLLALLCCCRVPRHQGSGSSPLACWVLPGLAPRPSALTLTPPWYLPFLFVNFVSPIRRLRAPRPHVSCLAPVALAMALGQPHLVPDLALPWVCCSCPQAPGCPQTPGCLHVSAPGCLHVLALDGSWGPPKQSGVGAAVLGPIPSLSPAASSHGYPPQGVCGGQAGSGEA